VVRYGFPSRYKLKKTDEFSSVFSFRQRIFGDSLALHYQPNRLGYPRLGIVVSKKLARRAVARNYMRRVLREWFRLHREELAAVDIVIRIQKAFGRDGFATIQQELQRLQARLQKHALRNSVTRNDGTSADLAG
jgi:ribonuclease P protein component